MDRVFISSTVYDLIDIRAELENLLRDIGLTPVLSGSATAEFALSQDANSIETCLANLRSCDAIILVLCQRYGPKLGAVGFEDISATHLEYKEAIKHKLPVYVYVRDRLEADFSLWKKNKKSKEVKLAWIPTENDRELFALLEERRKLTNKKKHSNWFDAFQSVIDLKKLVIRDFGPAARRVELKSLIADEKYPKINAILECNRQTNSTNVAFKIEIKNVGNISAYNLQYTLDRKSPSQTEEASQVYANLSCFPPGQSTYQSFITNVVTSWEKTLLIEYDLPQGHRIRDKYDVGSRAIESGFVANRCTLESREFVVGKSGNKVFSVKDS